MASSPTASLPTPSLRRIRNALLLLLTLTAGATDATAFLRLGHVFASVITGNLVVLGLSAARAHGHLALFAGCALGGYAVGVAFAAPRRREGSGKEPIWPPGTTLALSAELVLLVAFTVVWEIDGQAPARAVQIAMLVLCAAAMGIQSTAVRRIGQVSTTYLTSTLTGLLEAAVARRWGQTESRSIAILVALACGAAVAAILISHARSWSPAVQLLPLVIVVVTSLRLVRRPAGS